MTGHLVLSTLHTNSAVGSITRLIDMGIEPYLVSSAVSCIVAQRLVRKVCPACAADYSPSEQEARLLASSGLAVDRLKKKGQAAVSAEEADTGAERRFMRFCSWTIRSVR